ncbi:hypothetical protein H9P43_002557 [Blastocladiella emersonii ATCC 22665]|nr:hypothetical protein H9P43_002557 [Blastocladiella emersonii ATCC 22665]
MEPIPVRLPLELIEQILITAFLADQWTGAPDRFTRVAPGLTHLQAVIFKHSPSLYFSSALEKGNLPLLNGLARHRDPAKLYYSAYSTSVIAREGRIDLLNWLHRDSGLKMVYEDRTLDMASANGHVAVLQWFRESGLAMLYSASAIDGAAREGRIDVLDWWRSSGLELKYSNDAMGDAAARGRIDVLQWFLDSGLELEASKVAQKAADHNQLDVLRWCKANGIPVDHESINLASPCGNDALECLQLLVREFPAEMRAKDWSEGIVAAVNSDRVEVLDWIAKSVVPVDHPAWSAKADGTPRRLVDVASKQNSVGVLAWLVANLPAAALEYTEASLDDAESYTYDDPIIARLEWWKQSGLPLKYTAEAMDKATACGWDGVLRWWRDSGLELKYSGAGVAEAVHRGRAGVLEFWNGSGLPRWGRPEDMVRTSDEELSDTCLFAMQNLAYQLSDDVEE